MHISINIFKIIFRLVFDMGFDNSPVSKKLHPRMRVFITNGGGNSFPKSKAGVDLIIHF